MPKVINAKGLGCGVPVIMAKKALENHDEVTVIVDDTPNLENLKILARYNRCFVDVMRDMDNSYLIKIKKMDN